MDYLFDPAFFRFRISTCHEMSVVPGGAIAPRPVGRFPIVVLQSDVDAVDEAVRNRRATDEVVFLQKKNRQVQLVLRFGTAPFRNATSRSRFPASYGMSSSETEVSKISTTPSSERPPQRESTVDARRFAHSTLRRRARSSRPRE